MRKERGLPRRQAGQIILILILVMTVALAIGLSVIQRSLSDISTSTKLEQSSRAFSAAEAGIENKLKGGSGSVNFENIGSTALVSGGDLGPAEAAAGSQQVPLEFPPLSREETAHVWLADYSFLSNPPPNFYRQNTLEVYWGNSIDDKAALELTLVFYNGGYATRKWYLDHNITRNPDNRFEKVACNGSALGSNQYQCIKELNFTPQETAGLMLIRARLLYNSKSQPFAVRATGVCGRNCSLPPQSKIIVSTGTAGETQRKLQLFQQNRVVPPYFDYGIFSAGEIRK